MTTITLGSELHFSNYKVLSQQNSPGMWQEVGFSKRNEMHHTNRFPFQSSLANSLFHGKPASGAGGKRVRLLGKVAPGFIYFHALVFLPHARFFFTCCPTSALRAQPSRCTSACAHREDWKVSNKMLAAAKHGNRSRSPLHFLLFCTLVHQNGTLFRSLLLSFCSCLFCCGGSPTGARLR